MGLVPGEMTAWAPASTAALAWSTVSTVPAHTSISGWDLAMRAMPPGRRRGAEGHLRRGDAPGQQGLGQGHGLGLVLQGDDGDDPGIE